MKHTPGPWTVINDGDHLDIHYADYTQRREFTIASHVGGRNSIEIDANARLIAATPDLLEACRLAQLLIESGYPQRLPPHTTTLLARTNHAVNSALSLALGQKP